MKITKLKVVASSSIPNMSSLRGPKGRGQNDSVHEHITKAGFEPGEDVVVITQNDFTRLLKVPGYADLLKEELSLQRGTLQDELNDALKV